MKRILLAFTLFFSCSNLLYPQINIDGNITEAVSGNSHSTSAIPPAAGFGAATSSGNVPDGKYIVVFIDTLPVEFLEVDSHIIEDHSFIQWSVADDIDIDHYELEESNNGSIFHILRNIASKQNNFKTDYKEEDDNLNIGNNFYRVKAVSTNGTVVYSKILKIPYGRIDNTLFVYPNPVKDLLQIQLHGLLRGKYKLHIYSSSGQEIYNRYVEHDGIDKTITVSLPSTLQKGIYRLLFINKYEFYKQNFSIE
jgi:Secretion system C-terminal sorting domain